MIIPGPAVALLELESIARGMLAADALLKRAPVRLCLSEPVTPGKYLLLFSGGVAEVEEALSAAREVAGATLLDQLFLPQAAQALVDALEGRLEKMASSLGVVETQTVAAALLCADTALKRAEVDLVQLRLARGIGGKGYFVLDGELHMVEAAVSAAAAAIPSSLLVGTEIIQRPHSELRGPLLGDAGPR